MNARKQLILEEMTQNAKLMQAISDYVDATPHADFNEELMKEWHELSNKNYQMMVAYKSLTEDEIFLSKLEVL